MYAIQTVRDSTTVTLTASRDHPTLAILRDHPDLVGEQEAENGTVVLTFETQTTREARALIKHLIKLSNPAKVPK